MIKNRSPKSVGGVSYAFVARGYPSAINKKANNLAVMGYKYRIITEGRKSVLYIGPKRRRVKGKAKKVKLKKAKKPKKV